MTTPGLGTIVLYALHAGARNVWPAIVTGHLREDANQLSLTIFPEEAAPFTLLRVRPAIFFEKEDRRGVGFWVWNAPATDLVKPDEKATA